MKYILPVLVILITMFSACATLEEGADTGETDRQTQPRDEISGTAPAWYDHANRAYDDSLSFAGLGLAVAADSVSALEEAQKQAVAHLRLSIDRYAENIRREKAEEPGGEKFNSDRFILDLRNAVQHLDLIGDLDLTIEHIEKEDYVHNIYIRAKINKEVAISALETELGDAEFVKSIRERTSR